MPTKIKICGITQLFETDFINEAEIDYVGFVFAKSKRQVSCEKAKELAGALRGDIKKCGVFVEHSVDEINHIVKEVGLDIAQVHKNYTKEMVEEIDIPVWYAVNIKDAKSIVLANQANKYENVVGIVADSYLKGHQGGTGKTFNWNLLSGLDDSVKLILAGGLNAQNIQKAINKTAPYAVDVSSGVEEITNGDLHKSKDKVFDLVRKVKSND